MIEHEHLQVATDRIRLLIQARVISETNYQYLKAATDAGDAGAGPEEKRAKILAAAPACLKERVGNNEDLPLVEIMQKSGDDTKVKVEMEKGEEEGEEREKEKGAAKLAAVLDFVVMDGNLLAELFREIIEMMRPKWDEERVRQ